MEQLYTYYHNNATENNNSQALFYLDPELIRYRNATRIIYQRPVTLAAACFAVLFFIVGTVGNFLTIAALTSSPKLRKAKTTPFVINLCASHLLFSCFYLPLAASRYVHEQWIHGRELCSIFPFFFYGVIGVSMTTITLIAINRYIFINHFGIYHKVFKDSHIGLMIAGCWVFSFVILLPTLKGKWGTFGLEEETFACTILRKDGKTPKTLLFVFGYILPVFIITVSYIRIIYKYNKFMVVVKTFKKMGGSSFFIRKWVERIRKNKESTAGVTPEEPTAKSHQSHLPREPDELRLTVLMLVILGTFLGCFSLLMILTIADKHYTYPDLHIIAAILVWWSSSLNPVIYVYISKDYREAYTRILCPRRRKPIILTPTTLDDAALNEASGEA